MSSRRHQHEEHENHERWLVSYADFITLLFAFFVVMYSISSVNEGKYRVLSDALDATFRAAPRSDQVIGVGEQVKSPVKNPNAEQPGAQYGTPEAPVGDQAELLTPPGEGGEFITDPEVVAQKVRDSLADQIAKGTVVVGTGGEWVEIELRSQVLFDSGKAMVKDSALPTLRSVARALAPMTNRLQVEGYTDNAPIKTPMFDSNWELSAARAASVVQMFARSGVNPVRMAAVGYGEFRPKVGNNTPLGRQANRRVVVRISTVEDAKADSGDGREAAAPIAPGATPPREAKPDGAGVNERQTGAATDASDEAAATDDSETAEEPATESARTQPPVGDLEWIREPAKPEGLDLN
jgi:chemotaxis protein MotB